MLSIRSRSAAESLRSTPAITPPPARLTGSFTRASESTGLCRRIASLRPCSISAVNVVPRRSASRFACFRSPSSRRTVVLICLSVLLICQYAKLQRPCLASAADAAQQLLGLVVASLCPEPTKNAQSRFFYAAATAQSISVIRGT
jgi:hypothetical protein